jgi:hypothetical protein
MVLLVFAGAIPTEPSKVSARLSFVMQLAKYFQSGHRFYA